MSTELEGRHIVVTGGTGALGTAVVARLLDLGAMCHVPCYHLHELDHYPLRGHDRVNVIAGIDLCSEPVVESMYGDLDGLWASIHVCGGFAMAPLTETSLEQFESMWLMNAVTCFLCCREAVKRMRAAGRGGGRIVNVTARPALAPAGGMVAYTTSKAAVASLTQCLAEELKGEGIWVNAVAPSIMDTPANRAAMPEADHDAWPKVEDVARAIVNLALPSNALTSGAIVPVYGRA